MKLNVRTVSDLVSWVDIYDGARAQTRWVNPRKQDEVEKASMPEHLRGWLSYEEAREDPDMAAAAQAPVYIEKLEKFTPDILRAIGVDLEEDPPTDEHGFVIFDAEMIVDVWLHANRNQFRKKIKQHNQAMQVEQYEQKKKPRSSAGG